MAEGTIYTSTNYPDTKSDQLERIILALQGLSDSLGEQAGNSYTKEELDGGQLDDRYYTESEVDALLGNYYTKAQLNGGQLNNLYYTESELNAGQLNNLYYTESEVDALLGNYYTKTASDARYYAKSVTYTRSEIDGFFSLYYTAAQLNAGQLDSRYYTESEVDGFLNNYYTKAQLNAGQLNNIYYTESEVDAFFNNYYSKTVSDSRYVDNQTTSIETGGYWVQRGLIGSGADDAVTQFQVFGDQKVSGNLSLTGSASLFKLGNRLQWSSIGSTGSYLNAAEYAVVQNLASNTSISWVLVPNRGTGGSSDVTLYSTSAQNSALTLHSNGSRDVIFSFGSALRPLDIQLANAAGGGSLSVVNPAMRFFANGDIAVNATVDNGFKWSVTGSGSAGSVLFKGASATSGVLVKYTDVNDLALFTAYNVGRFVWGNVADNGLAMAQFGGDVDVLSNNIYFSQDIKLKSRTGGNVSIGPTTTVTGFGVAIGYNSVATYSGGTEGPIAIGASASATSSNGRAIAIGYSCSVTGNSVAIGREALSSANNELVFGRSDASGLANSFTDVYINGSRARQATTPGTSFTIHGAAAGTGSDVAGGNVTITGGRATGNAIGGDLIWQVSLQGASGSTLQSYSEAFRIKWNSKIILVNGATNTGEQFIINGSFRNNSTIRTGDIGAATSLAFKFGSLKSQAISGLNPTSDVLTAEYLEIEAGGSIKKVALRQ